MVRENVDATRDSKPTVKVIVVKDSRGNIINKNILTTNHKGKTWHVTLDELKAIKKNINLILKEVK